METITDDQALEQYMHEPDQSQSQVEVKSPWDHSQDMEEPDLRVDLRESPKIVTTIGYERINRPPADVSTPAGGITPQALKFQVTHNDADGKDPRLLVSILTIIIKLRMVDSFAAVWQKKNISNKPLM